ncbi:MAG: branched-chain amino acid ABC transporter permease [Actinobacteria bacterium]|nr:branched-chain amino acid ABC transporter permease [Actinomycetota bacterium]
MTTTATAPPATAPAVRRPWIVREAIGRFGLIFLLVAPIVVFAILDLQSEGNLTRLSNNLFSGVSNGTIIALIAVGYTLVYGIIELINLPHGEVFMLGSFTSSQFLTAVLGIGLATSALGIAGGIFISLVVAMLVCGTINVLIEKVAYRPLRGAPKLAPLITAVGMAFIMQNVGILWLGGSPVSVPDLIHAQQTVVTVFGIQVHRSDLLAFGVTIPLALGMTAFISRSRLGKAMRATAQDPHGARLMGINVDTTITATFFLGGLMAGAAGLVYALYETTIWYFQGFEGGLLAFTAAVIGGIGNLRGALLGGLIIGCVQQTSDNRIGPEWTPAIVFAYLILIMIFRPQGLLGEQTREAG